MQISDLAEWMRDARRARRRAAASGASSTCSTPSQDIGLGYLSLDRPAGTLSGGEAQRTKMIRHLGSSLTDVTYVFDEPTIGLHPHDIERMNDLLLQLRDKGNTVLVVEHKPETIAIADHVVDLGPGAGTAGGDDLLRGHRRGPAGQRHHHRSPPRRPGQPEGLGARVEPSALEIRGASTHNLQDVDVDVPARRAVRDHRCRRVGQELADPRLGRRPRRRRRGRPGRDPGVAPQQPGDVHRAARTDPQGLRQGQRRQAGTVQLQLRGRLPGLQGRRGDLHRARRDGDRRVDRARSARAGASRPRCSSTRFGGTEHRRGAGDVGRRGRAVLRRRRGQDARPPTRSSTGSPTSGSATSRSASR